MLNITLVPAYGRDYKSQAEVIAAWSEGKDFLIASLSHPSHGKYCSIRDFGGYSGIKLRYNKLKKVVVI